LLEGIPPSLTLRYLAGYPIPYKPYFETYPPTPFPSYFIKGRGNKKERGLRPLYNSLQFEARFYLYLAAFYCHCERSEAIYTFIEISTDTTVSSQ